MLKGKSNNNLFRCIRMTTVGLVAAIALPSLAHAALVCTSGSVLGAGDCTETVSAGPEAVTTTVPLTIDQWTSNAAPGYSETLLDVQVTYVTTLTGSVSFTNLSTLSQFDVTITAGTGVALGSGEPSNFPLTPTGTTGGASILQITVAPNQTESFSGSAIPLPSYVEEVTTDLDQFIGLGTYQVLEEEIPATGDGVAITLPPELLPVSNLGVIAGIDVEYDFTTTAVSGTPLPAALPLFATGLGALGLFGWRRKRKAAALAA